MAVITIREQRETETGFDATLIIEGDSYQIEVSEPFNTKQEQELEWYFEDWLIYPMLDNIKADRARDSIREYGEELFQQVFRVNPEAHRQYSDLKRNFSQLTIEIASINPEFQAIHWEALQDPALAHPLAIETTLIRKSISPKKIKIEVKESPTINLLVVVARPKAESDIPHRTISRPLVETIRKAKLPVNIEILRPGTYEALSKHLEAKENGYYHIVHFDVHGSLQNYETYQERIKIGIYPESRYGREEIGEYEGFKAFLALEGEKIGEYDPVEASEIANLLTSKNIPVCLLNACQSGKQLRSPQALLNKGGNEDNRETSLGSRLLNAGMQMVVAMSYSVTVTAAEIMMQQLYQHLFDEQDINQGILLGRKELYKRKARKAAYNIEIDLEDWLLPVVYRHGEIPFNLREFTPEEAAEYKSNLESKYKFVEPNYGFVGRDIDILLIEKSLLQHNILLLQGMGGTGKTTLLNYLQEWWQATKFAEDTFYFAYDKRAYTLQQIIFEISEKLYNQFDLERFQSKNISEQCQEISQKLRNKSYVLILDNLESITGQPLAIQNTLEKTEKTEIKNFLASLVGGNTKVILGSRIAEEWLEASTFQDQKYQLRGLDFQASSNLAANILQKTESSQSLDKIQTDEYFQRLMKLLAGNLLATKVILPNLKDKSPQKVLEQLENAEIDPGGDDKENNILKCIEYSYNNLSESSQKILSYLSSFCEFIWTEGKNIYFNELNKIGLLLDNSSNELQQAINEAITWELLYPIDRNNPSCLFIHPLLPCFLKTELKKANVNTQKSLDLAFCRLYRELAFVYFTWMESQELQTRQLGMTMTRWEYENLHQALKFSLEKEESFHNIFRCLYTYFRLTGKKERQLSLAENIYNQVFGNTPNIKSKKWLQDIIPLLNQLGISYRENRQYQAAETVYLQILNLLPKLTDRQSEQRDNDLTAAYHNLAIVEQSLKKYDRAKKHYYEALNICAKNSNIQQQAALCNDLGTLSQNIREFDEAESHYQQALEYKIKIGNRLSLVSTYCQLASLSVELRNSDKAEKNYNEAIAICRQENDYFNQVEILCRLGDVKRELRNFIDARKYFLEALMISIERHLDTLIPNIYHRLGVLSQESGEYSQAKIYYQKVIESYPGNHNQDNLPLGTYCQLGYVSIYLKEYEEAEKYYHKSLKIFIKQNDVYNRGRIYLQLGIVQHCLQKYIIADEYFQKSLNIFTECNAFYEQSKVDYHLGMLTQDLKEYQKAEEHYQKALSIKKKFNDQYAQGIIYIKLALLAEELLNFKKAKNYYLQLLKISAESEEREHLDFTLSKLAYLYKKTKDNDLIREIENMYSTVHFSPKTIVEIKNRLEEFK